MLISLTKFAWPLSLLFILVKGQELGVDYCSCSPSVYEISIDLNRTCEGSTFELSTGVENATCNIGIDAFRTFNKSATSRSKGANIAFSFDFMEYGKSGRELVRMLSIPVNRSTFELTSISSIETRKILSELPTRVELNFYATSTGDVHLVNQISFDFTNECQGRSIFEKGQTMGWAEIVS